MKAEFDPKKLHDDIDFTKKSFVKAKFIYSKIAVFGAQKTNTWSYRSQYKHYE